MATREKKGKAKAKKNYTLQVVLDTTAEPGEAEVIVIPRHLSVGPGSSSLRWIQISNEPFTFHSLRTSEIPNPFHSINVTSKVLTAQYSNAGGNKEIDYAIDVTHLNEVRSTVPGGGPVGNGGDPTIKNN
jgi:hypothetical protein